MDQSRKGEVYIFMKVYALEYVHEFANIMDKVIFLKHITKLSDRNIYIHIVFFCNS